MSLHCVLCHSVAPHEGIGKNCPFWHQSACRQAKWEKTGTEGASPLNYTACRKLNLCWHPHAQNLHALTFSKGRGFHGVLGTTWMVKAKIFLSSLEGTRGVGWAQKGVREHGRARLPACLPHTWPLGHGLVPELCTSALHPTGLCAPQAQQSFSWVKTSIKCAFWALCLFLKAISATKWKMLSLHQY